VPLKVKVVCRVAPTYAGSTTESVEIKVAALRPDGERAEHLTNSGWLPEQAHNIVPAAAAKPKVKDDGRIRVYDRSNLEGTARLLDPLEAKYEAYAGAWRVRVTKKLPELFTRWLATVPPHVEIDLDRELATLREQPVSGTVELNCEEAGIDWFDLKVVLNVTDTELTPEELKLLLNARGGYVRLGKKGWRRLEFNLTAEEDEQLARLGLNSRDFSAEPQRLHALQLADKAAAKFLPEQQVEQVRLRVDELKARVTPEIPAGISAQLRPYQIEGFHFLAYLSANRFGGILADDMGLGKTLQTLAWLAWLRSDATAAKLPSLVVCPKSVMDNWSSEAGRFLPGLRVKLWKGLDGSSLRGFLADTDLLVINYPQLRSIGEELAKVSWLANILDEGQYIKNPDSQTAQAARLLKSEHRLVLTGTPIENRLLDLWSLMSFAMPGVLGNRSTFAKRFDQDEDKFARRRLTARVRPFLLRRTKGQVARDLPDRIEEDLFCEMEDTQKTLYRAELKHARQMLLRVETRQELNDQRFNILTSLLRLRQICCHPALVDREHKKEESAKLNALIDLLEPLMEEGHKVLVFSQFVGMLDLIREAVKAREWNHFYLAGDTENRGELVANFQAAKGAAVFLISLKAGGFGLNLTAASYVALFDPWWNPAVENQAIDRTHRIGQTSKVIAYRLLIKGSIEEKIRKLQQQKSALAQDILGEESFASGLTLDDLRFLFSDQEEKI
jgi:SNF2 family DNA or RNA helicase